MSFQITDIFSYNHSVSGNVTDQESQSAKEASASQNSTNSSGTSGADIKLAPGSTISGQVVSVEGDTIQLRLNNGAEISAKLERGMQVAVGQKLSFDVKSIGANQLALRPLFSNTAIHSTISNGLAAAYLPVTGDSVEMITAMMNKGMSIDKNALQAMYRQVSSFPNASASDIVEMSGLKLPITADNIKQFEAYKNFEGQITDSLLELADHLQDTCASLMKEGNTEQAAALYKQVANIISDSVLTSGNTGGLDQAAANLQSGQNISEHAALAKGDVTHITDGLISGESISNETGGTLSGETAGAVTSEKAVSGGLADGVTNELASDNIRPDASEALSKADTFNEKNMNINMQNNEVQNKEVQNNDVINKNSNHSEVNSLPMMRLLNQSDRSVLADSLFNAGISKQLADSIRNGTITVKEFHNILKEKLTDSFLLKPEEVGEEGKVSKLYERLNENTAKLTNALTSMGQQDSALFGAAKQIQSNVEFVNQLNQNFQYIQLPLKMGGDSTQGDLYVYTNKRNLAQKDGNVSALLHLDMEHMGPVDVYVAMSDYEHVHTKFYLKDDNMLDFIESNIHILNERLSKRGYDMNTELIVSSGEKKEFPELLAGEGGNSNQTLISTKSFDARA